MADTASVRWQRVKDIFSDAIELPAELRPARIAEACAGDAALCEEVTALVRAHEQSGGFLETPAAIPPEISGQAAPERCGPYRIVRELGRGGMGVVYLGARDDDQFDKLAAIKVLSGELAHPIFVQRFQAERRILASLDHPNIARLLDAGTTDAGVPYVVMEYVDGEPVDVHCATRRLPVRDRVALFQQVCAAVQYSHARLVVHRDIKASNILVTAGGVPKLLDFGIAKLLDADGADSHATRTAFRALTPESASPEQVRGEPVTVSTDVYSLGVLLYRLLTGRSPYRGELKTAAGIARAVCDEAPTRPSEAAGVRDLRGDLDVITLKALSKDPARRYATVEQFANDLSRHVDGRPVLARPDSVRYRASRFVSRHKTGVAASALVAVAIVGGSVATAWEARVAGIERARAERRFNDVRRLANSFLFEFHDAIENLPGSTPARQLVVLRATQYLDSLASESAGDRLLQRELAAVYDKVGDVQGLPQFANLGDTAAALKSHQQALALRESLAAAAPADLDLQGDLVTMYTHLSFILDQMKDARAALDYCRKAFSIQQALLHANPAGAAQRRSLATGYHLMGSLLSGLGDRAAALDSFQHETAAFEALLELDPSNVQAQRDLALSYKVFGAEMERNGDAVTALANYRKSVALDEVRVRAHPDDAQAQLDLSFGYGAVGYTLASTGDPAGGLESYQRALTLRERVAAADSRNMNALDAVVRAHLSIGQVLRKANRWKEALPHLDTALEIAARRSAADPTNGAASDRLANIHGSLAATHASLAGAASGAAAAREWHDARDHARIALAIWSGKRDAGMLSAAGKVELDGLVALIAQCDAALAGIAKKETRQFLS